MKNRFTGDYDSSEGEIIKRVAFLKIRDSECGVVGWKYEVETPGVVVISNRTFDSFSEAVEDFQESRNK